MTPEFPRIAIVTGATSGIGEATAKEFVRAGFAVVGTGRTERKLDLLQGELGPAFVGRAGDAADPDLIDDLFRLARERFGREVDLVVANAGRGLGGSIRDADLSEFDSLLRVNVTGALRLMQAAAQRMAKAQETNFPAKPADIVVIGSVVGRHVSPFSAVYGSSKFAVHSLAEALRREVGPLGVRVTLVEPGFVLSGFQESAGYPDEMVERVKEKYHPILLSEDIARPILYSVSQPPHVHIGDLVIRPTRQDYP